MIEFCPGGAVDATMLGECLALGGSQLRGATRSPALLLLLLSHEFAYSPTWSTRCGSPWVFPKLLLMSFCDLNAAGEQQITRHVGEGSLTEGL